MFFFCEGLGKFDVSVAIWGALLSGWKLCGIFDWWDNEGNEVRGLEKRKCLGFIPVCMKLK